MPLANALQSVGHMDIVLFVTIGKPDSYQHKSLRTLATDFYPNILKLESVTNKYRDWLTADLPKFICYRYIPY